MRTLYNVRLMLLLSLLLPSLYLSGNVSPSLFTGRLTYTIPLYTIDDPDFHMDIALRYSSEGFKPFQPSGCYGRDWNLIAGGCITRVVQGYPDDQKNDHYLLYSIKDTLWGFSRAMQDGNRLDKNAVFDMADTVYAPCGLFMYPDRHISPPCKDNVIDYLPDIFYFDFCGYKGRFIINNHCEARIISGDFVKIDISQMKELSLSSTVSGSYAPEGKSYITIQTIDGYTYIFGGNKPSVEYSCVCRKSGHLYQDLPAVTAWHLTKIIAPNGRSITFDYVAVIPGSGVNNLQSFVTEYDWSESDNSSTTHIVYSLQKECLLQSITTSDSVPLVISFSSKNELLRMYDHSDFVNCLPHRLLDSMTVSYNGEILRTAKLSYYYKHWDIRLWATDNYHWRYLDQVKISGIGEYNMIYDDVDPYPGNAPHLTLFHYPDLYPTTDLEYKNMVDRMGFWKVTSLQGMLRRVVLPTGGQIRFTYGNHQYGEERRFRVVGTSDVELYSIPYYSVPTGGARIEKIETLSDDTTIVETKTFSYNKKGENKSSGVYYNIYEIFYPSAHNVGIPITNPYNYGMIDSHIGYSYVEQETRIGNEIYKTAYTYDTGISNYSSAANSSINRRNNINGYNDTTEVCSGSLTYPAKLSITGKLMAVQQYKGTNIVKYTLYGYNGIPNNLMGALPGTEVSLGCTDTIVVFSKYSGHIARKLYVYPDVLEKSVTYEHEGNSSDAIMMTDISYTYDKKLRRKKETTTDSRNRQLFTRYTYPDEIPLSNTLPYSQWPALCLLKGKYQINIPVETVSGYVSGNTEYVTNGSIGLYAVGTWLYPSQNNTPSSPAHVPPHISDSIIGSMFEIGYYPYLHKTLSLAITQPVTDYQPMGAEGVTVVYDARYKLKTEYLFSGMGRLLSVKPFGKTETKYTWRGLYPVSKTTGNQTYTYTYKPYVGINSVTDPRGITTYYVYDYAGRLIEVYQLVDGRKQILNVYQYHIKTE